MPTDSINSTKLEGSSAGFHARPACACFCGNKTETCIQNGSVRKPRFHTRHPSYLEPRACIPSLRFQVSLAGRNETEGWMMSTQSDSEQSSGRTEGNSDWNARPATGKKRTRTKTRNAVESSSRTFALSRRSWAASRVESKSKSGAQVQPFGLRTTE